MHLDLGKKCGNTCQNYCIGLEKFADTHMGPGLWEGKDWLTWFSLTNGWRGKWEIQDFTRLGGGRLPRRKDAEG